MKIIKKDLSRYDEIIYHTKGSILKWGSSQILTTWSGKG